MTEEKPVTSTTEDLFSGFDEDELKLLGLSGKEEQAEPAAEAEPAEAVEEEPQAEQVPTEPPEVVEWKEKYNNLLNALRESRAETQKWAGLVERLVGRLEQLEKGGGQAPQQEEELSEEERLAREQAKKVLQPELAQRDQALQYLMEQQRLAMLQNEYATKRAVFVQQQPDAIEAEVYASGIFSKLAEAMFPDHIPNAHFLRNSIINDIRMLFYSHPEGPGAVYRVAKALGFGSTASQSAPGQGQVQAAPPPPAQRSLSLIPGGKPAPAKTLQERAEALIKMDDQTFSKVDPEKIEAILKSLTK